ncbi:ADP-ribosylglycohydrolase family protein [Planctomycetota bacterium]|nr:ADP-ribosylglycohydrolase family protein [Planctomycetota bacterium]
MSYPESGKLHSKIDEVLNWGALRHEQGAGEAVDEVLKQLADVVDAARNKIEGLSVDAEMVKREPNDLEGIRGLRPEGRRKLVGSLSEIEGFEERLLGAMYARFAGCTLGAAVELLEIERMKGLAEVGGDAWPPVDYWSYVTNGDVVRYMKNRFIEYTKARIEGVPVDDDVAYTLMGLMVVERFGPGFGTGDVAKMWDEYIPIAYTAEERSLANFREGIKAEEAAEKNNPFSEWIGAWIRADGWGYMAAGWPEVAAELAYRDAVLSHRRNGVYGEMLFSAAIAAAFTVDCPLKAIELGLQEIPSNCRLAEAMRWALSVADEVTDYQDARDMVDEKFKGMNVVHAINNACLVVFGLVLGGLDVTKVIGNTVAMGMDNDCTAATAGSLVGAVVGAKGVQSHWTEPFGDTIQSYFKGIDSFGLTDIKERFVVQAGQVWDHFS